LGGTQNGGYVNPPAVKRSLRDPYGDWWDKQERRNFGEPVHEDNDMLGIFSLHEYTHFNTRQAVTSTLCYVGFIATVFGVVWWNFPGQQVAPRQFPGGLDVELGGKGAVLVSFLWLCVGGVGLMRRRLRRRRMSRLEHRNISFCCQ
jgi:NADH dehydrogenase (ubiquinone) 1 beta subcomplex subunit 8